MAPAEYHDAWARGFADGWQKFRRTPPAIPPMPESPPGVDPVVFYYTEGVKAGIRAAAGVD